MKHSASGYLHDTQTDLPQVALFEQNSSVGCRTVFTSSVIKMKCCKRESPPVKSLRFVALT